MNTIDNIFTIGIGRYHAPELLDITNKVFNDNQHLLIQKGPYFKTNLHTPQVPLIIQDQYVNTEHINEIKNGLFPYAKQYMQTIGAYALNKEYFIPTIWLNEMTANGEVYPHQHYGYIVTGCYYVSNPSPIKFYNPLADILIPGFLQAEPLTPTTHTARETTITPQVGDVLIWLSMLKHSVVVAGSHDAGIRRSLAFDVQCRGLIS